MEKLSLKCGTETEILLQYIIENLSKEQFEEIDVEREFDQVSGVGGEPLTINAILTLSPILTIAVTRLIERWLEARKHQKLIELIIQGFGVSEEAGKRLSDIVLKYNNVSFKQEFIKKQDII